MKIKSVILDTTVPVNGTNPALWAYNQSTLLDYQINKIISSGRQAIVVIGQDGDTLLRSCPKLDECDLVYSTSNAENAGLVAGLHGSGVCAFYLPIYVTFPDPSVWLELEKRFIQLPYQHKIHILKPGSESKDFPWLITKLGKDKFLNNSKTDMNDFNIDIVSKTSPLISKLSNDHGDLNNI